MIVGFPSGHLKPESSQIAQLGEFKKQVHFMQDTTEMLFWRVFNVIVRRVVAPVLFIYCSAKQMKLPVVLSVLLFAPLAFATAFNYTITILKPDPLAVISRPEYQASINLVGKSIPAIFGPISEVRVEFGGGNKTAIDEDAKKVEQKIRERIERAKCLGRDSEVAWHKAPWVRGHILFKDGRILPIQLLLSGIVVGDLLFTEKAEPPLSDPANGSQLIRAETNRTSLATGARRWPLRSAGN